ncbi:MAG: CAP domain-containing protein [Bacteroidota bacterium]
MRSAPFRPALELKQWRSLIGQLLVCTLFLVSCGPDPAPIEEEARIEEPNTSVVDVPSKPEPSATPAVFQAMVVAINDLRAKGCRCGGNQMPPVGPLRWNNTLATTAAQHSADMAKAGRLNHTGTDGSTAGDRIKRNGYSWRSYGENIAQGYPSAEAALQGWIESPGHCQNLMKADFMEFGAAVEKRFWTQVFARPF